MYECACGFSAGTATAFHRHLATASFDATTVHHLKSSNNRYGGGGGGGGANSGRSGGGAKANRPASVSVGDPPLGPVPSWAQGGFDGQQLPTSPPARQAPPRAASGAGRRTPQRSLGGLAAAAAPLAPEDEVLRIGRGLQWWEDEAVAAAGDAAVAATTAAAAPPPARGAGGSAASLLARGGRSGSGLDSLPSSSSGGWVSEYAGPSTAETTPRSARVNANTNKSGSGGGWFGFGSASKQQQQQSQERAAPSRVALAAAPAASPAKHTLNGSLMAAVQGYSWLSGTVGHAASAAVLAAAAMAAASTALPGDPPVTLVADRDTGGGAAGRPDSGGGDEVARKRRGAAAVVGGDIAAGRPPPGGAWQRIWDSAMGPPSPEGQCGEDLIRADWHPADSGEADLALSQQQQQQQQQPPLARRTRSGGSLRRSGGRAAAAAARRAARGDAGPRGEAVRALLLWRDFGASARALGFGLYLIMLAGYLPSGLEYLQITSVLPGAAMGLMGYNLAKRPLAYGYAKVVGASRDEVLRSLARAEGRAASRAGAAAAGAVQGLVAWVAGALALAARALSCRSFTAACWTFVCLWVLMLISELRLVPQILLAMVAYASLFVVPPIYTRFRDAMDAAVYETVHLGHLLIAGCERLSLALAAVGAAGAWHCAETAGASLVVRATGAFAAGLAVLVWRTVTA